MSSSIRTTINNASKRHHHNQKDIPIATCNRDLKTVNPELKETIDEIFAAIDAIRKESKEIRFIAPTLRKFQHVISHCFTPYPVDQKKQMAEKKTEPQQIKEVVINLEDTKPPLNEKTKEVRRKFSQDNNCVTFNQVWVTRDRLQNMIKNIDDYVAQSKLTPESNLDDYLKIDQIKRLFKRIVAILDEKIVRTTPLEQIDKQRLELKNRLQLLAKEGDELNQRAQINTIVEQLQKADAQLEQAHKDHITTWLSESEKFNLELLSDNIHTLLEKAQKLAAEMPLVVELEHVTQKS